MGASAVRSSVMFCQQCGKELPAGATTCPSCGAAVGGRAGASFSGTLDQAVTEAKRAAKDLLQATAQITRQAADHAEAAGKDPAGTAKKVAHRVAQELDDAARKIDQALKDL
jgi:zinc-ribbon domain